MSNSMIENSKEFLKYNAREATKNCVWNMGTPCIGDTNTRTMFGQMEIPICDQHYLEHVLLTTLKLADNLEVENLVEAEPWMREKLVEEIYGTKSMTESLCRRLLKKTGHQVDDLPADQMYEEFIKHLV